MRKSNKHDRILEIICLVFRNESFSAVWLARKHRVSKKSISRDICVVRMFLAEHRDLVGYKNLIYDSRSRTYYLA